MRTRDLGLDKRAADRRVAKHLKLFYRVVVAARRGKNAAELQVHLMDIGVAVLDGPCQRLRLPQTGGHTGGAARGFEIVGFRERVQSASVFQRVERAVDLTACCHEM